MTIRVLIADDHAMLRAGLKMLNETQADLEVLGGRRLYGITKRVSEPHPKRSAAGFDNAGGNGIKCIEQLSREFPNVRILVLTMHDDRLIFACFGCRGLRVIW